MNNQTINLFVVAGAALIVVLIILALDGNSTPAEAAPIIVEEQTVIEQPAFNPRKKEFKLDNGTPCVMVWAPNRAQSSGISCDWRYNEK